MPGNFLVASWNAGKRSMMRLRREPREETGFEVDIVDHISTRISRVRHVDVSYLARIRSGLLHVEPQEILDARFFHCRELPPGLSPEQLLMLRPVLETVMRNFARKQLERTANV